MTRTYLPNVVGQSNLPSTAGSLRRPYRMGWLATLSVAATAYVLTGCGPSQPEEPVYGGSPLEQSVVGSTGSGESAQPQATSKRGCPVWGGTKQIPCADYHRVLGKDGKPIGW